MRLFDCARAPGPPMGRGHPEDGLGRSGSGHGAVAASAEGPIRTPDSLFELWEKTLDYMVKYVASMGIDVYATIAVPFYGIAAEKWDECLNKMPEYLKEDRVLCVGEIGLDVGQRPRAIAHAGAGRHGQGSQHAHHRPRARRRGSRRPSTGDDRRSSTCSRRRTSRWRRPSSITAARTRIPERLKSGCVTGLSICYDKLTAEEAAEIVEQNPTDRDMIIIGSELGYGGAGHLSVVKAAWGMKKDGMPVSEIERVTWDNPRRMFGLA